MRKLAYLLAAVLAVSLPSAAHAAKAKAKAAAKPAAAKADPNTAFLRAIDNLVASFQPKADKGKSKGKKK